MNSIGTCRDAGKTAKTICQHPIKCNSTSLPHLHVQLDNGWNDPTENEKITHE